MSQAVLDAPVETPIVELKQAIDLSVIEDKKARAILFTKMVNVMDKVEWIPKRGWNDFHKYNYVQEADVVNHIRKALVENKLSILPPNVLRWTPNGQTMVVDVECAIGCGDTGEIIKGVISVEGQDKGDKKFPKAYASATKYFLMKTFLIPTGDDPEGDISTDKAIYGNDGAKPATTKKGNGQAPTKVDVENQINSLLMQLTQNGYQGTYVYQLCKTQIGKDFNILSDLELPDLTTIRSLLSTELGKVTN